MIFIVSIFKSIRISNINNNVKCCTRINQLQIDVVNLSSKSTTTNLSIKRKSNVGLSKHENDKKSSSITTRPVDQMSIVPHPVSRLRLFKFALNADATEREQNLRQKRIELQNWNHEYWSKINQEFNQEKKDYIQNELKNPNKEELSASQSHEELANFYKNFLDRNHSRHIRYNFEWYRKHVSLLWPSLLVSIERLLARFKPGS